MANTAKVPDPKEPVTINVQVPRGLRHRFKVAMIEQNKTFSEGVTEALTLFLDGVPIGKNSRVAGRK